MNTTILVAALRSGVQALMPTLVWLAAKGHVEFGPDQQLWFTNGLVIPLGVGAYTWVVWWLEHRDTPLTRFLARVLMIGLRPAARSAAVAARED